MNESHLPIIEGPQRNCESSSRITCHKYTTAHYEVRMYVNFKKSIKPADIHAFMH